MRGHTCCSVGSRAQLALCKLEIVRGVNQLKRVQLLLPAPSTSWGLHQAGGVWSGPVTPCLILLILWVHSVRLRGLLLGIDRYKMFCPLLTDLCMPAFVPKVPPLPAPSIAHLPCGLNLPHFPPETQQVPVSYSCLCKLCTAVCLDFVHSRMEGRVKRMLGIVWAVELAAPS